MSDIADKISMLPQDQFEQLFINLQKKIAEDPMENFIKSNLFLATIPTPGQSVLFKLVFKQALDPITTHPHYVECTEPNGAFEVRTDFLTEIEIYERFTGTPYVYEDAVNITDITLIVGRRGGKSLTAGELSIYNTVKEDWLNYLGKHKTATSLVMSHTREFSDEVIDVVRSLMEDSPILSRCVDKSKKNTQSTINLKMPFTHKNKTRYCGNRIRTNAASSKSSRGSACPTIVADEIAFWGSDENSKETDLEIVRAARPSQLQFRDKAMFIKLSSPGIKHGVLWEDYNGREKAPKSVVVLKAPTWEFNNMVPIEFLQEEHRKDPTNFDREFRANFAESISAFILPEMVDLCTIKGALFLPPTEDPQKGDNVIYSASIDAAYKGDRFVFTLVGHMGNRVRQFVAKSWKGDRINPVRAHDVAKYVGTVCKNYGISQVSADQYSFQPLREIFEQYDIALQERVFTNTFKKQIYFNLRRLIHSQQMDLLDIPMMANEIKQLQVEQGNSGTIKISHPPGGTDDFADALAIACFIATERSGVGEIAGLTGGSAYGIKTDITGRAFDAPSPEMLQDFYQTEIIDNSNIIGEKWKKNEKTGEWEETDQDDPDDETGGGPSFLF